MGRKSGSLVRFVCHLCGAVESVSGGTSFHRCLACRDAGIDPRPRMAHDWTGRAIAQGIVSVAVRDGRLPIAKLFRCADCAGPASEYEHRDYNRPLDVQPICRGCNLRRGPAIPRDGAIEATVARGFAPYRLRRNARRLLVMMGRSPEVLDGMPAKLTVEHWRVILPVYRGTKGAPKVAEAAKA